jgi:predicted aspartyl protease
VVSRYVRAKNIALGTLKKDEMDFDVLPMGMPGDEDGLIGENILSMYDIDFDFAQGKVNFLRSENCDGTVVYWTNSPVDVIPFWRDAAGHIRFNADLDGKQISAAIDTGAAGTVASWETISDDFSLEDTSPNVTRTPMGKSARYSFPFKALSFGGVAVNNPNITLVPSDISAIRGQGPTILIGANILRELHLYIATSQNKLYITPASAH